LLPALPQLDRHGLLQADPNIPDLFTAENSNFEYENLKNKLLNVDPDCGYKNNITIIYCH
jgi:hypothetical protein